LPWQKVRDSVEVKLYHLKPAHSDVSKVVGRPF
jgi:hypothetical protein